jgi:hypothetical protein
VIKVKSSVILPVLKAALLHITDDSDIERSIGCVQFMVDSGRLTVVTTDGYHCFVYDGPHKGRAYEILIRREVCHALVNQLEKSCDTWVTLSYDRISVGVVPLELTTRLIDLPKGFPDWRSPVIFDGRTKTPGAAIPCSVIDARFLSRLAKTSRYLDAATDKRPAPVELWLPRLGENQAYLNPVQVVFVTGDDATAKISIMPMRLGNSENAEQFAAKTGVRVRRSKRGAPYRWSVSIDGMPTSSGTGSSVDICVGHVEASIARIREQARKLGT